jgi:hypothetical protein
MSHLGLVYWKLSLKVLFAKVAILNTLIKTMVFGRNR